MRNWRSLRSVGAGLLLGLAGLVSLTCGGGGGGGGGGGPTGPGPVTSVTGAVLSAATGGGIPDITVTLVSGSEAGLKTTTGLDGAYTLTGFSQAAPVVRASGPRYETSEATTVTSRLDFSLLRRECQGSSCNLWPSNCNEEMPMLEMPVRGSWPVSAMFDHTTPFLDAPDGRFVSYCGGGGQYDGHSGWDWVMPEGTPVYAAAGGTVIFAGKEEPFYCPFLDREVSGNTVVLSHTSPHGEEILTAYAHFKSFAVNEGDSVRQGQKIGRSGNTGCSTGPHLHFSVLRREAGPNNNGFDTAFYVDPMGWQGDGRDPWAVSNEGAVSSWMWEAPIGAMAHSAEFVRDLQNLPLRDLLHRPIR